MTPDEIKLPMEIDDFEEGDIPCVKCGKILHLWYNGGELDKITCCGLLYKTESKGTFLRIAELPT